MHLSKDNERKKTTTESHDFSPQEFFGADPQRAVRLDTARKGIAGGEENGGRQRTVAAKSCSIAGLCTSTRLVT